MEGANPKILREIELRVGRAVSRYGVGGTVRIEGDDVVLDTAGALVATELGDLASSWQELDSDEKQRRVTALARTLVVSRGIGKAPPRKNRRGQLLALLFVTLALAGAYFGYQHFDRSGDPAPGPSEEEVEAARARERARQACEEASARAERGETIAPGDTRGWVVELALMRGDGPSLAFDPGLLAFVDRAPGRFRGRFVWAGAPEIARHQGPGTHVEVIKIGIPNAALRGVSLLFEGRYVAQYFDRDGRAAFVRTAEAIAARLDVPYAAIYARCAHLPARHAAAWIRGPSSAGAAAALIYYLAPTRDAGGAPLSFSPSAFGRIAAASEDVELEVVQRLVAPHGGDAATGDDGSVTLTFPFDDSARARRAALGAARALGIE